METDTELLSVTGEDDRQQQSDGYDEPEDELVVVWTNPDQQVYRSDGNQPQINETSAEQHRQETVWSSEQCTKNCFCVSTSTSSTHEDCADVTHVEGEADCVVKDETKTDISCCNSDDATSSGTTTTSAPPKEPVFASISPTEDIDGTDTYELSTASTEASSIWFGDVSDTVAVSEEDCTRSRSRPYVVEAAAGMEIVYESKADRRTTMAAATAELLASPGSYRSSAEESRYRFRPGDPRMSLTRRMITSQTPLSVAAEGPFGSIPCRVVLLGDAGVGKSSLIDAFVHPKTRCRGGAAHESCVHPNTTICYDFATLRVSFSDDAVALVTIIDTAGAERYRSMHPSMLRNADVVLVVFDVNDVRTLNNVIEWTDLIQQSSSYSRVSNQPASKQTDGDNEPPPAIVLVGNKVDILCDGHDDEEGDSVSRVFRHRSKTMRTTRDTGRDKAHQAVDSRGFVLGYKCCDRIPCFRVVVRCGFVCKRARRASRDICESCSRKKVSTDNNKNYNSNNKHRRRRRR
jgi:small GTP-binding protein